MPDCTPQIKTRPDGSRFLQGCPEGRTLEESISIALSANCTPEETQLCKGRHCQVVTAVELAEILNGFQPELKDHRRTYDQFVGQIGSGAVLLSPTAEDLLHRVGSMGRILLDSLAHFEITEIRSFPFRLAVLKVYGDYKAYRIENFDEVFGNDIFRVHNSTMTYSAVLFYE